MLIKSNTDKMDTDKTKLSEYIGKVLDLEWAGRATFVSSEYSDARDVFNQTVTPKLVKIVENEEQARVAGRILLSKIEIDFKDLTFRDMDPGGVERGAYDHHLYPTCYDLDDVGMTLAVGFKDHGASELLNNPKQLSQLINEILAKEKSAEKST